MPTFLYFSVLVASLAVLPAAGAAQEKPAGYLGILTGTEGPGAELASALGPTVAVGMRVQGWAWADQKSVYAVAPLTLRSGEIRLSATPGIGARYCAPLELGGSGYTGCDFSPEWELAGIALVAADIFPHALPRWSVGGELGVVVTDNPRPTFAAGAAIRFWP